MRESNTTPIPLDQAITALADGTLRGRRRAEAEARLAQHPDLRHALERQRHAVALLRQLAPEPSPALRARIAEQRRRAGDLSRA